MHIIRTTARPINDTRGRPTIETTLTAGSLSATASVPSGKSTGEHEAVEIDAGKAVENVTGEIAAALAEHSFNSLDDLDNFLIKLDGTPDKSRLGANAILSVSLAAMRLNALQKGIPLWMAIARRAGTSPSAPRLFVNVINGGVHARPAEASAKEGYFRLPFQEYLLVIEGKTSAALPIVQKAFAMLGELLRMSDVHSSSGHLTSANDLPMGDEGGYSPTFNTVEEPFEILTKLVDEYPKETAIALDAAASQLCKDGAYTILGKSYSADELAHVYEQLVARFPIMSIEDPFDEHASANFARFTEEADKRILVVGDDFTCTNPALIASALKNKAVNAVLIKPNQIGTVMEAIESVKIAQSAGLKVIASHRSGETNDTFISDFAYGIGAYGVKAGGLAQPERLAKYERLIEIENEAKSV